jgi:integrase/recombinase XerD
MNQLSSAIADFLNHCLFEKNLSHKTLKAYKIDLLQFESFLIINNKYLEPNNISKHEIREFLTTLSSLKPKSIKRKVASVKALFNFLEFEDQIVINPLRKMKINIKEPKKLPLILELREILKIFKIAYKDLCNNECKKKYSNFESIRNVVIIELLFSTGARVSEIADLKRENINLDSGSIIINGKGNKERIIHVCNSETINILRKYNSFYQSKMSKANGYFLINRFGKKLSDQSIRNFVKKISRKAGIIKNITPHIFRHSFATLLLEKDVDIKYIQSLLGHSSIMTTQIYTHVNRVRQKQILRTKHPRKDFSMLPITDN